MSRLDPKVTLLQIRDAANRAREICSDYDKLESLVADWKATAALERFIEFLGEAVKRLPVDIRESYDVPWKDIAGTRDHLSHGYDNLGFLPDRRGPETQSQVTLTSY